MSDAKYNEQPMVTTREESSHPLTRHARLTTGEVTKAVRATTNDAKAMAAEAMSVA